MRKENNGNQEQQHATGNDQAEKNDNASLFKESAGTDGTPDNTGMAEGSDKDSVMSASGTYAGMAGGEGQAEQQHLFYTPEEMRGLDFNAVDTSRIPPEHLPFYKSMQASFTKSKQKEHERLKEAAKSASTQLPQANAGANFGMTYNEYRQIYARAEDMITSQAKQAGEEIDPFSPIFLGAVQSAANRMVEQAQSAQHANAIYQSQVAEARRRYGADFATVDNIAQEILDNEYPAAMARTVYDAIRAGNYAPLFVVMDEAKSRIAGHTAQPLTPATMAGAPPAGIPGMIPGMIQQQPKQAKQPPATMGAGKSTTGGAKDDTFKLFGF